MADNKNSKTQYKAAPLSRLEKHEWARTDPSQPHPTHYAYYARTPKISSLSPLERRLIMAFRFSVMAGKRNLDVIQMLQMRIGSLETAIQLSRLVKRLADRWEGPFLISPPCCQNMTADEAIVADMLHAAMVNDRNTFDATLHLMFSAPVITDFWWVSRAVSMSALHAVL